MSLSLSFHFPQRLPPVTSFKWLCVHLSYIDTSILICLIFPSHSSLNCDIFLHGCLPSVTFYLQHFVAGVSFLFLRELRHTFLPFQSHRLYGSLPTVPILSFPPSAPLRVCLVLFANHFHHSLLSVAPGHFTEDVAACWVFSSSPCSNS